MTSTEQPRAVSQQPLELRNIEHPRFPIDAPLLDRNSVRGQFPPGAAVGFVILIADDNLVTRLQQLAESLGEHIGVLRGRRPEMDFVGGHAEVFGHARTSGIHPLAGLCGGCVGVVRLYLQSLVILVEAVDDRPAGVGAAGILEERLILE